MPAHWELGRVKTYFQTTSGGTPNTSQQELYYAAEEDGIHWIRTTDLQNDILRSAEVFITEQALADTACAILPPGTVMVAMYGGDGTVGKNGLLAFPAAINQAVCGLLPSATHDPEYVFRFMQFYRPYWMIGAESSRKDPNISQERVRNAPFPKPPRDEQDAIVAFLRTQLQSFDRLIAEAQHAIELLQERRTALISAAVTGQVNLGGGTLGGIGTVGAIVTGTAGGVISPGNSIGTLMATSLDMSLGGSFKLEIDSTPTAQSDKLELSAGLTLGGLLSVIDPSDAGSTVLALGTKLPFITYGTSVTGLFSFGGNLINDFDTNPSDVFTVGVNTFGIDYNDGNNVSLVAAVPEPGTIGSLVGGFGVLLGLRRRKSRRA